MVGLRAFSNFNIYQSMVNRIIDTKLNALGLFENFANNWPITTILKKPSSSVCLIIRLSSPFCGISRGAASLS